MSEPQRYESLTIWRGLACLMVVIFHSIFNGYERAFQANAGNAAWILSVLNRFWIGVPIFFVISGYCIIASADAIRARPRAGRTFFWRRFRRIYPAYWCWLAAAVAAVWVTETFLHPGFFETTPPGSIPSPQRLTWWQWFGNLTLTETWRWNYFGKTEAEFLGPSWTLCYEEQFYAVIGLTLLFAPRFLFAVPVFVTFVVIGGFFLFPWLGFNTWGLFLDGKWLMFAAGILVYYLVHYASPRQGAWLSLPLAVALLATLETPSRLLLPRINDLTQSCFVAFAFAGLLLYLHRWDDKLQRARLLRPLKYCGERCYSLYLVHWPVVMVVGRAFDLLGMQSFAAALFISLPVCLAVSIGSASLFHLLVERRFMNRGFRREPGRGGFEPDYWTRKNACREGIGTTYGPSAWPTGNHGPLTSGADSSTPHGSAGFCHSIMIWLWSTLIRVRRLSKTSGSVSKP